MALPQRLIELYTFEDDLVLDPFLGSGSTAVAAARTGRRWSGWDTDPAHVATAEARVAEALADGGLDPRWRSALDAAQAMVGLAEAALERAGFRVVQRQRRVPGVGLTIDLAAEDAAGTAWSFDVSGGFTTARPSGLGRTDELLRCLGRVAVLAGAGVTPLVLLTSQLPAPGSAGDKALRTGGQGRFADPVELFDEAGAERLAALARG